VPKINRYYDVRALVTRHKIATALVAGFCATHLATMFGYWDHAFGFQVLNWNYGLGLQFVPPSAHASYSTTYLIGEMAHYTDGIVFGFLYVFVVHPLIPIRNTVLGNLLKGLIWGTILAFISAIFMNPYVFEPNAHLGFFSLNAGFDFVLSIFIWHWIYGATLGQIYNPLPDDEVVKDTVALRTTTTTNGSTAETAHTGTGAIPAGMPTAGVVGA
jgi:hypothetical protein